MSTLRLCILACICSALGVSSVGAAGSSIEPSDVHTKAADVATDFSVDLIGYAVDGGGISRADGLTISGTIQALGARFPMSAGTLSVYGEFVAPYIGSAQGNAGISTDDATASSLAEERAAPV